MLGGSVVCYSMPIYLSSMMIFSLYLHLFFTQFDFSIIPFYYYMELSNQLVKYSVTPFDLSKDLQSCRKSENIVLSHKYSLNTELTVGQAL